MSEALRKAAVAFIGNAAGPVASPALAEAIGADPAELPHLLAYPLALNLIRSWRVGAALMWSKSTGMTLADTEPDPWPIHQSVVPAPQAAPLVFIRPKEGESHDAIDP